MFSAVLLLALSAPPKVDTVAGDGQRGYSGDGDKAITARLSEPFHCELDGKSNLYIAEALNHCIRKVDLKTGVITTVAGNGKKGYSGDGGPATKATFNEPYAVVVDGDDNLYIADRLNAVIRKVDGKTGVVSTLVGTGKPGSGGDGPATTIPLREPNDVFLDGKGGLLIADVADWRIRRVDLKTGMLTTFAGSGPFRGVPTKEALGDGGPATKALIVEARAVCVDVHGNTFICERRGNTIRKVDAKGVVTTIAGSRQQGAKDGPGLEATFRNPKGIRADRAGNLFIVDTENHSIRRIDAATGQVTTVAGGRKGKDSASMDRPHGCIVDGQGVIYIADSNNHRVQRVQSQGK